VVDPELVCGVRDAGIVAAEDDLAVPGEAFPAAQGVALDEANVAVERLWNREDRKHRVEPYRGGFEPVPSERP